MGIHQHFVKNSHWIIVSAIILLAVFLRALLIFPGELIPGINGGYYPLMVKSFLGSGSLPFRDAPLSFWMEALLSRLLMIASSNTDQAVLLSAKIVDSIIPALIVIPVWSAAYKKTKDLIFASIIGGFAALFFPLSWLLTGDMHKNAIALLWLAILLNLALSDTDRLARLRAGIIGCYVLIALTHFGTFLTALLLLPMVWKHFYPYVKEKVKGSYLNSFTILLLIALSARWERLAELIGTPMKLFEHPLLWYIIDGQPVLSGYLLGFGVLMQVLALSALILAVLKRKGIFLSLAAVFLSSPLTGIEWYMRLTVMSYIPLIFAIIIIWPELSQKTRKPALTILLTLSLLSAFLVSTGKRPFSITTDELTELTEIRDRRLVAADDMVITRHGMEWWTAWFLGCHIAQEQAIQPADFERYTRVMVLRQPPQTIQTLQRMQPNFVNPDTESGAPGIFVGKHLTLSLVSREPYPFIQDNRSYIGKGNLIRDAEKGWVFNSGLYSHPILLSAEQEKTLLSAYDPNFRYQVYGDKRIFSLKIRLTEFSILDALPEN